MTAPRGLASALPQYDIGGKIGEGGMGEVFGGVHRSLGRKVAIKQLPGELIDKPGMNARFDREARVLASLDHPHIVPVYDYVRTGRDNLLVMEKLDGGTVYSRFRAEGLTGEQSCAIALAMLSGLHAAHQAGVLHLDVKPKNLLFTAQGVMKVADFGIAQVVSEGATLVTHGGEVLGTPAYIAPEQAMGNPLSPAADIYAAGTVLYELLSGALPYDTTRGALAMMRQHIFADPQPISRVPQPLAGVVMRSLARDPLARYRDAEAFAVDLAAAATAVFGLGWLDRANVPVHLSARVMGAVATQTGRLTEPATMITPRVRGTVPEPTRATSPGDLRGQTLMPASELLAPSRSPLVPALVAIAALVGLIVLTLVSPTALGHPDKVQVAVGAVGALDLSKPVPVTVATATKPTKVAVTLSAAGVPLSSATTTTTWADPKAGFDATLTFQPIARWVVGGTATATVTVVEASGVTTTQLVPVTTRQHPLTSAMGTGSLLLGLFALAYLESTLRVLRRGHRRVSAPYTAAPLGALFGAAVWMLLSVLADHEPSVPHGVGAAVLGAVAAVFAVLATQFAARRRITF